MPGERTRGRGELETQVLRVLWTASEPLSALEIQAALDGRTSAYSTLMTVLDRLAKKGHVVRSGESPRKIRFEAARSDDEHASQSMLHALHGAGDRQAALLQFAGNLDDDDMELLRSAIRSGRGKRV